MAKWSSAYFWYFTPLPTMIYVNDLFWYTWDTFAYWGDANYSRMKPHMYNNWFTKLLMK